MDLKRRYTSGKPYQFFYPLGDNLYLTTGIYKNNTPIHIRRYGTNEETGKPFPTPEGLCMGYEEFVKLMSFVESGQATGSEGVMSDWRCVTRSKNGYMFVQRRDGREELEVSSAQMTKIVKR